MYEWLDDPQQVAQLGLTDEMLSNLHNLRARMAREPMTTTRPTAAGFTQAAATLPKVTVEVRQISDEERKRRALARVEAELAECDGCTGVCQKTNFKYNLPVAVERNGVIVVTSTRCSYGVQRELERAVSSSKIPDRYVGKTLADYKVDAANVDAVSFAKIASASKIGAYFYGECGTGKTFLAAIVAQDFLRQGKSVLFVKVPNLLDDIKATFGGKGSELAILDEIEAADLVVLDDFGMEKPTQWAGATLCKILDMRYDGRAKTLVTSNLSPKMLAEQLNNASDGVNFNGSRIFDRLREICKPILFKGTSRRN